MRTPASVCWLDLVQHNSDRPEREPVMSRQATAAGLATLAALSIAWLLLALSSAPLTYLVTPHPQPTYLTGRLVSMLAG
jgi:hypothetical protein